MRAKQLIEGASFNPDQLAILRQAFDQAWAHVEPKVSAGVEAIEAARLKLANAVLAVARGGSFEADRIKADALWVINAETSFSPRSSG